MCVSHLVMSEFLQPHGLHAACQVPLFMEFSRQEYWSGFPFPSPGDLPNPGIKPGSPTLQADPLPSDPLIWAKLFTNTLLIQGNALLIYRHALKERV